MAMEGRTISITARAAVSMRGWRGLFVAIVPSDSDQIPRVTLATSNGGLPRNLHGCIGHPPPTGDDKAINVVLFGEGRLIAAEQIRTGDLLSCNGSGQAIVATSGMLVGAIAHSAAYAGDEIMALIGTPSWRLTY